MAVRLFAISGAALFWLAMLLAAFILGLIVPFTIPDFPGNEGHTIFTAFYTAVLIAFPFILSARGLELSGRPAEWHVRFMVVAGALALMMLDAAYVQSPLAIWMTDTFSQTVIYVTVVWPLLHVVLIAKTVQIAIGLLTRDALDPEGDGPPEPDALLDMAEDRRWLTRDLYRRSDAMRARANLILMAIIALILGGLVSIYVAGDLVSGDAQTVTRLQQLTQTIDGIEAELDAKDTELAQLASQEASLLVAARDLRRRIYDLSGDQSPGLWEISKGIEPEEARVLQGPVSALPEGLPAEELRDRIALRDRQIQVAENDRAELVSNYREVETRRLNEKARRADIAKTLATLEENLSTNIDSYLVSAKREPSDVSLLLASGITRFGILLVVIFLVQILVGVYRYSLRLSAFYAGRADALVAAKDRKSDLGAWEAAFTPMDIDFGRQPVTPAQYVVDVVRAYMSKEKKAKAKPADAEAAQI